MNYKFKVHIDENDKDVIVGWKPRTFSTYNYKRIKAKELEQDTSGYCYYIIFNITKNELNENEKNSLSCITNGLKIDTYSFQVGEKEEVFGWLNTSGADKELRSASKEETLNRSICTSAPYGSTDTLVATKISNLSLYEVHPIKVKLTNITSIIIKNNNENGESITRTIKLGSNSSEGLRYTYSDKVFYKIKDHIYKYECTSTEINRDISDFTYFESSDTDDVLFGCESRFAIKNALIYSGAVQCKVKCDFDDETVYVSRIKQNMSDNYDFMFISQRVCNSGGSTTITDSFGNILKDINTSSSKTLSVCTYDQNDKYYKSITVSYNSPNVTLYMPDNTSYVTIHPDCIHIHKINSGESFTYTNIFRPCGKTTYGPTGYFSTYNGITCKTNS